MPIIIKVFKSRKASQTILGYVENHKEKNGTLTMGGVVFLLTTLVLSFFFLKYEHTWFITLLTSVFFGVLGFMDDYLKIKFKQKGNVVTFTLPPFSLHNLTVLKW